MFSITILILIISVYSCQSQLLGLYEGDTCKNLGDKVWKCELLRNCPQIGNVQVIRPAICGFEGRDPIICCPPPISRLISVTPPPLVFIGNGKVKNETTNINQTDDSTTVSPLRVKDNTTNGDIENLTSNGNALRNCLLNVLNHCLISTRIRRSATRIPGFIHVVMGGTPAKPKEYRSMALIGYGEGDSKSWNCGGSLLSEKWILSAAHCAYPKSIGAAKWARVGELNLTSTTEDAQPQEKRIIQIIIYPKYQEPEVYHDIALFKLDSNIIFNSWVAPICLQDKEEIQASRATVTGWGRLEFAADVSPHLQEVEISLVNNSECVRLYKGNEDRRLPRGIDAKTMICAGEKEGGKDACTGDSGGPLMIQKENECLKTQIGIISFGRDCGLPNTPGVYTRISYYIPWIESILWPDH